MDLIPIRFSKEEAQEWEEMKKRGEIKTITVAKTESSTTLKDLLKEYSESGKIQNQMLKNKKGRE